eukprot:574005_1
MGCCLCHCNNCYDRICRKNKDYRLLMIGLDASGKTTILYRLKFGEYVNIPNQIGFNVETIEYHNLHLTLWDVVGATKVRHLWHHYFENTHALIYVIDSNDRERFTEIQYSKSSQLLLVHGYINRMQNSSIKEQIIPTSINDICFEYYFTDDSTEESAIKELHKAINHEAMKDDLILLVFANKQDLPNAMTVEEIQNGLQLDSYAKLKTWHIQPSSATTGDGLYQGMQWLSQQIN